MQPIFQIYEDKLCKSGLTEAGAPLLGYRDAQLTWNMDHRACAELEKVFEHLNINALLFSRPAEPYWRIINYLAKTAGNAIFPEDCETRTFLHDLPISRQFTSETIVPILKARKSVIIPDRGIVTHGTVNLEQAFVTFSSICFACFVKFFHDALSSLKKGKLDNRRQQVFDRVVKVLDPPVCFDGALMKGPFGSETEVYAAIQEAGKQIVDHRLVDSYFGNISLRYEDTLFISQTGSSLDNLKGCVDPCPLDGSSCVAITASSELPAHLQIVKNTEYNAILHGHPKFSVILSMDCDIENCECSNKCHIKCPHERSVCNIPVVSGEVGSGPHGLYKTVPRAIESSSGVIVYGHGLFTAGVEDFNQPFRNLLEIENNCREEYFIRMNALR
ncbi:class II aldolase/adducin family protein [Thermodesulfobacteriota bacterium]